MKIAFDVGGVLSRYPEFFQPLLAALYSHLRGPHGRELVEIHVISDMHSRPQIAHLLDRNGFGFIDKDRVHSADYARYGPACKAVLCRELGIDALVDDCPDYLAAPDAPPLRLLVLPDLGRPYYSPNWQTDGSEGAFGRHRLDPAKLRNMSGERLLGLLVPQTYGEAVQRYGPALVNCEPHEWDNRTTLENALWLTEKLARTS